MMKEILIASKNSGKIKEYQKVFNELNIKIKTLLDLEHEDVEETGSTFKVNALLKAKSLYDKVSLPVLADDSGLVVNALPSELGVKSKRFSKSEDDEDNIDLLLSKLEDKNDRSAYFTTVICLYFNHDDIRYYEGITKGIIINKRRGSNGFGYDPIFLVPEISKTYAELNLEEKQIVSHRGKAINALLEDLKNEIINL